MGTPLSFFFLNYYYYYYYYFYGCICGIWMFPGQGLNPSAAAIHATVVATPDPLTHCAGPGIEPAPL